MLLSNPYRPDPRVLWEAEALINAGHRVSLIAWDRQVELPAHEIKGGLEVFRIHSARSSYAAGLKQALRVPSFWRAADGLGIHVPGGRGRRFESEVEELEAHGGHPANLLDNIPGGVVHSSNEHGSIRFSSMS